MNSTELSDLKDIKYNSKVDWEINKTVANISDKVELTDYENNNHSEIILHGSSGTFIINSSGGDYTSLNSWEAGEEADLTGSGPCIANITEGFLDTGGRVDIDGWTTDADDFIKIETTTEARHNGSLDLTGDVYALQYTFIGGGDFVFDMDEEYTYIDGLIISVTSGYTGNFFLPAYTIVDTNITNNILSVNSGAGAVNGVSTWGNGRTHRVANNIFIDMAIGLRLQYGSAYVYSNTFYNVSESIKIENAGTHVIKNNIAQKCSTACYVGSFDGASTKNIADDNTNVSGENCSVSFVDVINNDFHLVVGDTCAKDSGVDLSSDSNHPFNIDLDGEIRAGTWDIGSDEFNTSYRDPDDDDILDDWDSCDYTISACTEVNDYGCCNDTVNGDTLTLYMPDTENLEDTEVDEGSPSTNYGSEVDLHISSESGDATRVYASFNLTTLLDVKGVLDSAEYCLYQIGVDLGSSDNVSIYEVFNKSWDESVLTWNNQPCGTNFNDSTNCNLTAEDNEDYDTVNGYECISVLSMVNRNFINSNWNISMVLKTPESDGVGTGDRLNSKEAGSSKPYLNITYSVGIDETPPYFTDISNQTINNVTALSYDINASDGTGMSCFTVNDTTNFNIDCDGVLVNNTQLSVQLYNLNITINDTSNNLNSSLMWVNVTGYIPSANCWTETDGRIAIPPTCKYYTNVKEFLKPA